MGKSDCNREYNTRDQWDSEGIPLKEYLFECIPLPHHGIVLGR